LAWEFEHVWKLWLQRLDSHAKLLAFLAAIDFVLVQLAADWAVGAETHTANSFWLVDAARNANAFAIVIRRSVTAGTELVFAGG
jgi:hypothetical protein